MSAKCEGSGASKLIFACSGAADVGAIADQAARKMTREGNGKMFCTVGIGGKVGPIMENTKAAEKILAIDGCPLDCVKNCLKEAGFNDFAHLRVTDCGMEKGKTEVSDFNITKIAHRGSELLI